LAFFSKQVTAFEKKQNFVWTQESDVFLGAMAEQNLLLGFTMLNHDLLKGQPETYRVIF